MLKISTIVKKNNIPNLRQRIIDIANQKVFFGYYAAQGTHYSGLSYPELMAIHEFGVHGVGFNGAGIPPRPVLSITMKIVKAGGAKQVYTPLSKYFGRLGVTSKSEFYLSKIGLNLATTAQKLFGKSPPLTPNSSWTTKAKGFNKPLVWTGDLKANIAYSTSKDSNYRVV